MISLIASIYKSEKYIVDFKENVKECFNILLQQGVQAELIIIANDPSEFENTVLEELSGYSFVRQIKVPRESLYRSWNRGVLEAKGQIIGFWNVDSNRLPTAILDAYHLITKGASLVYFPFIEHRYVEVFGFRVRVFKRNMSAIFNEQKLFTSMVYGPHFMFSRELYNHIGHFDEQFSMVGDYEWCLRAAYNGAVVMPSDHISGIMYLRVRGLSGVQRSRLLVEENVIYTRYGFWDKLIIVDNVLMHKYNPYRIRYGDQNIAYKTLLPLESAQYIKSHSSPLV